jgi:thiamine pyrophosphate-dependent acetolactate synthase large subunit-like protein
MPIDKLPKHVISVPQAIARVLEEAGIDLVFGIPGSRTGAIFDALYDRRDSIRVVLVREEGLATVMADVYGRLTGKPGVAMGCVGIRVERPEELSSALEQALAADRPAVVDVVTSGRVTFRDVTSPLVSGAPLTRSVARAS